MADVNSNSPTFHLFPKLPAELRYTIWESAIEDSPPQAEVHVRLSKYTTEILWSTPTPGLFLATKESQQITMRTTNMRSFQVGCKNHWNSRRIWFDPQTMVLDISLHVAVSVRAGFDRPNRDWSTLLSALHDPLSSAQHIHLNTSDYLELHRGSASRTLLEDLTQIGSLTKVITASELPASRLSLRRFRIQFRSVFDETTRSYHWFRAWRVRMRSEIPALKASVHGGDHMRKEVFLEGRERLPIGHEVLAQQDEAWDRALAKWLSRR